MKILTVRYNYKTDKTTLSISREFREKEPKDIHDLDALQDAMQQITDYYNYAVRNFLKGKDNA